MRVNTVLTLFLLLPFLAVVGCEAPTVQVGPASQPMVEIQSGAVVVQREAIILRVEPGAVTIDAQTAPLPDTIFNRLWLWVGIALVAGVVGYWANRWVRLAVRRLRTGKAGG